MRLTHPKKGRFNFKTVKSNILLFTIRPLIYTLATCTPTERTCFLFSNDLPSFLLIIVSKFQGDKESFSLPPYWPFRIILQSARANNNNKLY